jgi:surface protein
MPFYFLLSISILLLSACSNEKSATLEQNNISTTIVKENNTTNENNHTVTADSQAPKIEIKGDLVLYVKLNSPYTDPGAKVTDNKDTQIEVSTQSNVETSVEGTYDIVYRATDSSGNVSSATRKVIVQNLPFILLVDTSKDGNSSHTEFQIPIDKKARYNYDVDCNDDGTLEATGVTGSYTCTYEKKGRYIVSIKGEFPTIHFYRGNVDQSNSDSLKVIEIRQWGNIVWHTMYRAFYGCRNMHITATDRPNLSHVETMKEMFAYASSMNEDIEDWNVSNVKDMSYTFRDAMSFNKALAKWDVSKVSNMRYMFYNSVFFNQPLNAWDVSHTQNMQGMFGKAFSFNQPLDKWNTARVHNMSQMFTHASNFNMGIGTWNVGRVMNMSNMFNNAKSFNQPIGAWNVSRVITMRGMFYNTYNFDQDIGSWDTHNVRDTSHMFLSAKAFDQDIGMWNMGKVIQMRRMFYNARAFFTDLSSWNVSQVTNYSEFTKHSPLEYESVLLPHFGQ